MATMQDWGSVDTSAIVVPRAYGSGRVPVGLALLSAAAVLCLPHGMAHGDRLTAWLFLTLASCGIFLACMAFQGARLKHQAGRLVVQVPGTVCCGEAIPIDVTVTADRHPVSVQTLQAELVRQTTRQGMTRSDVVETAVSRLKTTVPAKGSSDFVVSVGLPTFAVPDQHDSNETVSWLLLVSVHMPWTMVCMRATLPIHVSAVMATETVTPLPA